MSASKPPGTNSEDGDQQFIAHETLGQNRPTGLKDTHLDWAFFSTVLGPRGELLSWSEFDLMDSVCLSGLMKTEGKKTGIFGFKLTYKDASGSIQTLPVVMKSKPTDVAYSNWLNQMSPSLGVNLAETLGLGHCSTCEVSIAELENPELKAFLPRIYHTIHSPSEELYVIVMEYLTSEHFILLDTRDDISDWTMESIKVVLRDVAKMHSLFLSKVDWLRSQPWLKREKSARVAPFWKGLLKSARAESPELWTEERVSLLNSAIDNLPQIWSVMEAAPQTLVHNDCNIRNICLRKPEGSHTTDSNSPSVAAKGDFTPYSDPHTLCMYDWELVTITVPQYDVIDFLSFALQPATPTHTRLELLDFYRQHLQYYSGMEFPMKKFVEVFNMACLDYAIIRILILSTLIKDTLYVPRVVNSLLTYLTDQAAQGVFQTVFTTK